MMEKECRKCGYLVKKDFITYKTKVWDEKLEIPMVEGYKCSKCKHIEVDEKVQERLNIKILEHKLDMYKEGRAKILLINNVKSTRQLKGIAQGKLGSSLGFTEQRFGAIERNDNTPTIYLAGVISELLGVSIYDLYSFQRVPMDIFLELENMNSKFEIIKGLPEVRKQHYMAIDEDREIRDNTNELKAKMRSLKKRIYDRLDKIDKINAKKIVKSEVSKLIDEVKQLDKEINILKKKIRSLTDKKIKKQIHNDEYEKLRQHQRKIENLQEKYQKKLDEIREISIDKTYLDEIREFNNQIKNLETQIEPLENKLTELQVQISSLLEQIRALEKSGDCILKQGYCLDKEDWEKVKEKYGKRLK